ncbi:MAG: thiamine pyrophosphate-dependent enzyme, partial [Anaerolineae bacterium]|nr:thiamine pyrophosphate-dependent enzyme [Anaerolineae bacterium]
MLDTYRNDRPYPFCPGCSHGLILNALDRALVKLGRDPRRIVIVSDIGCHGLSDQYFITNAFHGLHGRSIAYASGIKLADPDLTVIVLIGDGGVGIGAAHLVSAARRNIGLTVLVFNNFNFGMTGGEHSVTTPSGGVTATTRGGNPERPLDLCATVAANGAGFAWRGTAFDRDLAEVVVAALESECFAPVSYTHLRA